MVPRWCCGRAGPSPWLSIRGEPGREEAREGVMRGWTTQRPPATRAEWVSTSPPIFPSFSPELEIADKIFTTTSCSVTLLPRSDSFHSVGGHPRSTRTPPLIQTPLSAAFGTVPDNPAAQVRECSRAARLCCNRIHLRLVLQKWLCCGWTTDDTQREPESDCIPRAIGHFLWLLFVQLFACHVSRRAAAALAQRRELSRPRSRSSQSQSLRAAPRRQRWRLPPIEEGYLNLHDYLSLSDGFF